MLFLSVSVALVLSGCADRLLDYVRGPQLKVEEGKMIYARQVLEHYDAKGNAVPQYYELWAVQGKSAYRELNANGEEVVTALDSGNRHIAFSSGTGEAVKSRRSRVFLLDFNALKRNYPVETVNEGQKYVGRDCTVHLLENNDGDDWLKIYRDSETGLVLFCDAPLFVLKTASVEILPTDPEKFSEPQGLDFR